MSNPFDRNKTKEARLGELITEIGDQNQRDAVHIAVVPITAHARLSPGEAIGVTTDGKHSAFTDSNVGIVDPFLTKKVEAGQTFWLFLFQGSVNTLRHEWTHPAFPSETPKAEVSQRVVKEMSEVWLRAYALRVNHYYEPDEAYVVLMNDIKSGSITYHGTDMHSRGDLISENDLRHHAEIVLGRKVNFDDYEFSCTC